MKQITITITPSIELNKPPKTEVTSNGFIGPADLSALLTVVAAQFADQARVKEAEIVHAQMMAQHAMNGAGMRLAS